MGNAAVDIARIVTRRLGIPRALVADLSQAEEISHRVRVREDSAMAHRTLADLELPVEVGMRVVALRRGREWNTEIEGDMVLLPGDVLFLQGAAAGIAELRAAGRGAGLGAAPGADEPAVSDLDRAIDVLVEMKNISEVAVGLAYSALVLRDQGLAAEVNHLEDRLDEMMERLELWVLRAAQEQVDPSALRGLMHLAQAAEEIGDAAQQMVWLDRAGRGAPPHPGPGPGRRRGGGGAGAGGRGLAGRRPLARRSCAWRRRPASTCWPSAGAGATSTGPSRRSCSRPRTTSSSPPAPTRATPSWPPCAATS